METQIRYNFTSKSGGRYELRLGKDGRVYCTCPAWRFSGRNGAARTCKHIQAFERASFEKNLVPHDGMVL